MKPIRFATMAAMGLALSPVASAVDGVNTSVKLACNVAGLYADGSRVRGSGSEEIAIEIRRINRNEREPAKLPAWTARSEIRITSNGRSYEAALLKSTPEQVAFVFANEAQVDGSGQSLALTYEIRLDRLRLKRTVMTLFAADGNALQSAEGNCVRLDVAPATATTTAAPASGPAPDWLVELRRKLKECASKDPFSEAACVERMQARYCANRSVQFPECSAK